MWFFISYLVFYLLWSREVKAQLADVTGLWERARQDATREEGGRGLL